MRIFLIFVLTTINIFARVVGEIDDRAFKFEEYNFIISNDGSLFNIDSSKAGLYSELDSMQYIKDAGLIITGFNDDNGVYLSNIHRLSNASALPGIAKFGKELDSLNKDNYQVYFSKDYDENGVPLFGEQIPNWPVFSQKRGIDDKSIPIFIDDNSKRISNDLFKPYFLGENDIFTIYKVFDDNNLIQVENLISLFPDQIIFNYKLINYGNNIDSCMVSFYLDPDISNHKRIFQDIFNDDVNFNNRPFITDKSQSNTKTLSLATLHFPEINDLDVIHPFFGTENKDSFRVFSLYDVAQNFKDARILQKFNSIKSPDKIGDTRILINNEAFNFKSGDTIFVSYSVNFAETRSDITETYKEIENKINQSKNLFRNIFTSVEFANKEMTLDNFDIYSVDGRLIKSNANNLNNIENGKYLLIDSNNPNKIKKIIIDK